MLMEDSTGIIESSPVSMYTYASNFEHLLAELKDDLSKDEIDALIADISALGEYGWVDFVQNNLEMIDSFLQSTPDQRANLKQFQEPRLKRLLNFAAAQRLNAALTVFDKLFIDDFNGLPFRKASVVAADYYYDYCYDYPGDCWLFDAPPPEGFLIK